MATAESSILFHLDGLSKIYTMGQSVLYALNRVTLDIYAGEFLMIMGPSGSGKTTLLNIVGATDRPTEGKLYFKDQELTSFSDRALTRYRRDEVGFIFQFYNLLPTLTALENVQVSTEIAQHPMKPLDALTLVDLQTYANHFPAELSGGQQQRVSVARALAGDPSILLCDEPTGALDSAMSKQIIDLLVKINREFKKTIIFITHNEHLSAVGDRVVYLSDGKIVRIQENS
jgi:putative ABC transport system ATP-binding protein